MTIEEVSVLFDTGRKGDAKAAALHFSHGKDRDDIDSRKNSDVEKDATGQAVTHVESS